MRTFVLLQFNAEGEEISSLYLMVNSKETVEEKEAYQMKRLSALALDNIASDDEATVYAELFDQDSWELIDSYGVPPQTLPLNELREYF